MGVPSLRNHLVVVIGLLVGVPGHRADAQSFDLAKSQLEIAVAPGFSQRDVQVPFTAASADFDASTVSVSSGVPWIIPSVDVAANAVALSFNTASLTNATNSGTVTVVGPAVTRTLSVKATVAPLNVVSLVDDPIRSRTYGIHQNGTNQGALIVIDPIDEAKVGSVSLGRKPTDLAVSKTGDELVVICTVDKTLTFVDLETLRVKETVSLPSFQNWGVESTTADVAYGPGSVIYFTDGSWGPVLRVLNRQTGQVLQSVTEPSSYGYGDFAVSEDNSFVLAWVQYGWSAGWAGAYLVRFSIDGQGKLTAAERTSSTYPTVLSRDPLDTPVFIAPAGTMAFAKQHGVNPVSLADPVRVFPKPIRAMSHGGEVVTTDSGVFEAKTGKALLNLPVVTTVQAITSDYARLVYFDAQQRVVKTLKLLEALGPEVLQREFEPADGAVTTSPAQLVWTLLPGVSRYQVYLGTSSEEVAAATSSSRTYLGEFSTFAVGLSSPLVPGTKYFWRVDAVTSGGVAKGDVRSFTVSIVSLDRSSVAAATVECDPSHDVQLKMGSATDGVAWTATPTASWITLEQTNGVTPATLNIKLDATKAGVGDFEGAVQISVAGQSELSVPVRLSVKPLALTVIEADRTSDKLFAISESTVGGVGSGAFLLEIDSRSKTVERVVPAGSGVTDLAIHKAEGRVYVANWVPGNLRAFDLTTLEQVQSYGFTAAGPTGYGNNDVYRIAAGARGRLVVEEQDQWIDVSIFDTSSGAKLANVGLREGGGKFDPTGRFYFHGENNSSGAQLLKFDVLGDVFTKLGEIRVTSASYYGSRVVTVSADGNRVFWNGGVFDGDLNLVWELGAIVYSTSGDGRFAFGEEAVFDTQAKSTALAMPVNTRVSAYNSSTKRLVVQMGRQIRFFDVDPARPLSAPASLTAIPAGPGGVRLDWVESSLETGFAIQMRPSGAVDWQDLPVGAGKDATSHTLAGLDAGVYEFRVSAFSPSYTSDWSSSVFVTVTSAPPPPPPAFSGKVVYRLSSRGQQTGNGGFASYTATGYLIWNPVTKELAQIFQIRDGRAKRFHTMKFSDEPRIIQGPRNIRIMVFPFVGQDGKSMEASLVRGVVSNLWIGTGSVDAPTSMTSSSWTFLHDDQQPPLLVESLERYTFDRNMTLGSNAKRESVSQLLDRIAADFERSGFQRRD